MSKFTREQIAWAKQMVQQINDKGTWAIPANGCVYQFFREPKEIVLIDGDPTQDDWHERNVELFAEIGWTVKDGRAKKGVRKIGSPHGQGKTSPSASQKDWKWN